MNKIRALALAAIASDIVYVCCICKLKYEEGYNKALRDMNTTLTKVRVHRAKHK